MKDMRGQKAITRRGFLKGATVAGGAIAGVALVSATGESQTPPRSASGKWDREADVVIVGSGASGLAAAVEAADSKAKVMVLEKLPGIGGNSKMSFGNYGTFNSPEQRKGAEKDAHWYANDSADLFIKEKLLLGGYLNDAALVRVFVEQSLDGYNWLTNLGFTHNGIAIYHSLGPNPMPENPLAMRMNMLWNTPYVDGAWQGPYTKGRQHTGGKYQDFLAGEAGVMCLADHAKKRGAQILTQMEVLEIIRKGGLSGDVLGVRVKDIAANKVIRIRAKRAVVLAAGGFTANGKMCNRYDPRLNPAVRASCQATGKPGIGCTGEVLLAAMDIGADAALLHIQQLRMSGSAVAYSGPGSALIAEKEGTFIDVDNQGNRFWMEGGDQSVYRQARLTILHEKDIYQWWGICDSAAANKVYLKGALETKSALAADTLPQLAEVIKVPAANLVATVDRYNKFVEQNYDADFGQFKKFLTQKIEAGPFYAMPKTYYRHASVGGVRINVNAQVLDRQNRVIPRLYSAGEMIGNLQGWERDGGCGWTTCTVFGRIAGRNASAEKPLA
ncbi:MAG TPA: FAD-dependent oxidoreductase [Thermodesulfobacteriota bacterium]|nr:FAD-dependent oxidoreductase [Thermodesulfobacteriota bacterium]